MNFYKDKNILVTGAAGFTGSHLVENLVNKGSNITVLLRNSKNIANLENCIDRITIVEGDIRDDKIMHKAVKDQEMVFHFATFLGHDIKGVLAAAKEPVKTFDINTVGALNTINSAVLEEVSRFIFISTCHVYGEQPINLLPLKEDVVPNPLDIYATSKYAAELSLKPFTNKIDVIITRAFNQYGPGHVGDYFVPKVVTSFLKGEKPVLWSPYTTRDYSYVDDVVEGYALVGERGKSNNIYHFSSGKETSMGEMLGVIATAFGISQIDVEWKSDRPQDFSRSCGDSSKARNELGWQPNISLEDGMKRTVEWWKKHSELWDLR